MKDVHASLVLQEHLIKKAENILDGLILAQRLQQGEESLGRLWAICLEKFTAILRLECFVSGDKLKVAVRYHLRLVIRLPSDWSLANVVCLLVQDRCGCHCTYKWKSKVN